MFLTRVMFRKLKKSSAIGSEINQTVTNMGDNCNQIGQIQKE